MEVNSDPVTAALRAELAQVRQELHEWEESDKAKELLQPTMKELLEERDALAAALTSTLNQHRVSIGGPFDGSCAHCGNKWPCETSQLRKLASKILTARDERMRREGAAAELEQLLKSEIESLLRDPDRENAQLQAIPVERIEERAAELREGK